jgi:hypothetical protein
LKVSLIHYITLCESTISIIKSITKKSHIAISMASWKFTRTME